MDAPKNPPVVPSIILINCPGDCAQRDNHRNAVALAMEPLMELALSSNEEPENEAARLWWMRKGWSVRKNESGGGYTLSHA